MTTSFCASLTHTSCQTLTAPKCQAMHRTVIPLINSFLTLQNKASTDFAKSKLPPAADREGSKEKYAYILAPQQMVPGDSIKSGIGAGIKTGNSLPLSAIPVGTALHNVEMHPGKGGQLARSAGTAARLVTKGQLHLKPLSL